MSHRHTERSATDGRVRRQALLTAAIAVLLGLVGAVIPVTAAGAARLPLTTMQDPAATSPDEFGGAVAVSGTTAVVGVEGEYETWSPGAAYIYSKGPSGWPTTPTVTLADPSTGRHDVFGDAVAVSGTTVVIGALGTHNYRGAVYIFSKRPSGWPTTPSVTLHDPAVPAALDDMFGGAVAVSATTIVASGWDPAAEAPAVYVYVKGSSGWPTTPTITLPAPSPATDSAYGASIGLSGTTLVVGNADVFADPGMNGGPTYVYEEGPSGWPTVPTVTLQDPAGDGSDEFGVAVAVSGTTIVVGAESGITASRYETGTAYVYVEGVSGWPNTPTVTLPSPLRKLPAFFGDSVAVSGTTLVVGAFEADGGAAYVYAKGTSGWATTPSVTLHDPVATYPDWFGCGVAASGTTAMIGAPGTNSSVGSAYIYRV